MARLGKQRSGPRRIGSQCAAVAAALLFAFVTSPPALSHWGAEHVCSLPGATTKEPEPGPAVLHPVDSAPERLDDGWPVSTLETEGIRSGLIDQALSAIRDGDFPKLDGLLIAHGGKLVLEAYFNGFHREAKHDTRSAFKSVTSALLGIAVDKGLIADVEEPLSAYFQDYWPAIDHDLDRKGRITLAHMLTMTPGFDAEENWGRGPDREMAMWRSADWIGYSLGLPMAYEPGRQFSYNSSTTFLLGQVVERAAGMPLQDFARSNLFEPLGILDYCWTLSTKGRAVAQGSFFMRPRDMLKLGQLFLDRGLWHGRRLISEDWVEVSTRHQVGSASPDSERSVANREGYGYQWWTYRARNPRFNQYFASGNGGQKIYVFPDLDLVVVFTGSNYNKSIGHAQIIEIFKTYLVPAFLGLLR